MRSGGGAGIKMQPAGREGSGGQTNPLREAREQLEHAEMLRRQGKFERAESICSALLRKYPDYFGALHTLGLIHADRGNYRRAVAPLVEAVMLNPRSWITYTALAGVYLRLDAKEMAAQALEQARAIKPNEASILVTLGEVYREEREYELARDVLEQAVAAEPDLEAAIVGLASVYGTLGENRKAVDTLNALFARRSPSLGALISLLSLPKQFIERDVLQDLAKLGPADGLNEEENKTILAFVKAAALDKAGRYSEAWQQAVAANQIVLPNIKDQLAAQIREREIRLAWLKELSPANAGINDEKLPVSLFILGSSRSGKTTLEQVAARLEGVMCGHENPSVENAISRTFQEAGLLTTHWLGYLPPQFYPGVRELYADELARRGAISAKVFTNTHPVYITNAAHIAAIIPNARFIFIKRNADDLTLRIFMKQYERGNPYAYDVDTIRAHIEWYNQMIDLLAQKFPKISRVINYEDMVGDPLATLRTAAELCGAAISNEALPPIGDDRDCAKPYREFLTAR
jgi:tetratricopeptide (TPR) repeat protein